jgi:5-methylcytosine-specific restriction protein A
MKRPLLAAPRSDKRVDPFYLSKAWRAIRAFVLRRDGHRCVICGADVSGKGQARVDHIQPRSTHPHLALDPTNCRTLCGTLESGGNNCDAQAHRERASGGGPRNERFAMRGCDADGWPLRPR